MIIRLLIAAHKPVLQGRLRTLLSGLDVLVRTIKESSALWESVSAESYDFLVISRRLLPSPVGDLIRTVRALPDSPEVLVLTSNEDPEDNARLLAEGCYAVLNTAVSNDMLRNSLRAMVERRSDQSIALRVNSTNRKVQPSLSNFVSSSPSMQRFLRFVRRVVSSDTSLLISGETGVGKEWLARAIHYEGPRSKYPFVAVNCGALAETLLESELFGHEEGSFTGATRTRRGMFELAHQGTIFLDEIGEMPKHLQVKLLRVLQSREIQKLGSERSIQLDVRIMAATNRELEKEVESQSFRRDLYYRLSVVDLVIPPLRERVEDIPTLIENYMDHFRSQFPQIIEGIDPAALEACIRYDWPGNVRELINVIERAMLICEGTCLSLEDLPENISREITKPIPQSSNWLTKIPDHWTTLTLEQLKLQVFAKLEGSYLRALLTENNGSIGLTAKRAGIDPRSLYNKMKRFGIDKKEFKG